jgi:hypothetical protein
LYSHEDWLRVIWDAYNAANGETRVATGDVDGDGKDEIVVGFGPVSGNASVPGGWFEIFDDDRSPLGWGRLSWASYNSTYGDTRPACGDVDGDGLDEIIVGLGSGGNGWVEIFDYSGGSVTHKSWVQVDWAGYNTSNGETRPAAGDLDGDGRDEVVVGLGPGARGWLEVVDDATAGYGHLVWAAVDWASYNSAHGETRPACGDVDGDGVDEIIVGLGAGGGGYLEVFDYSSGSVTHKAWLRVHWGAYNSSVGETRPASGDLDGDGRDEVAVGLGPGGSGYLEVLDDASAGYAHLGWPRVDWSTYNTANGETWPAIKR